MDEDAGFVYLALVEQEPLKVFFSNPAESIVFWQMKRPPADSEAGKWSVKNMTKWRATVSVGHLVVGTSFLPMKVMRENDPEHSPAIVMSTYPEISLFIDLSHDHPPYDTLGDYIPHYIKLSSISKQIPHPTTVTSFIDVCDRHWSKNPSAVIAVHCHYGFNRTGFMICAYLIERRGLGVIEALRLFAEARPEGIKHQHFQNELFKRYEKPQ